MLVPVISMLGVPVSTVDVIHVIAVLHGEVTAAFPVLMRVVEMTRV